MQKRFGYQKFKFFTSVHKNWNTVKMPRMPRCFDGVDSTRRLWACSHLFPKQATLCPETGDFVAENGNKIARFWIQSCRFWQQSRLFPESLLFREQVWTGLKETSFLFLFQAILLPFSATSVDRPYGYYVSRQNSIKVRPCWWPCR